MLWARGPQVPGGVWPLLSAGPSPRHFCAGVELCCGPALTTRDRHAQRLVCPTWAQHRVGDRPLLRLAHDLRILALTLRWAETEPLLRWARVPLLCPYFALGLDFATLVRLPGSPTLTLTWRTPFLRWAPARCVQAAHLGRARTLLLTPFPGARPSLTRRLGRVTRPGARLRAAGRAQPRAGAWDSKGGERD